MIPPAKVHGAGDGHRAILRHHRQWFDLQRGEPGDGMDWGTLRPAGGWTARHRQPVRNEENIGKMVVEWDFIVI